MRVSLCVKWEDIEKYERGEEITAAIREEARAVFQWYSGPLVTVHVPTKDVLRRESITGRGIATGTFSKFTIQKM